MVSPLCGFRPLRAERAATLKVPRPDTRTASPATRESRMAFTTAFTACSAVAWFSSVARATFSISSDWFISDLQLHCYKTPALARAGLSQCSRPISLPGVTVRSVRMPASVGTRVVAIYTQHRTTRRGLSGKMAHDAAPRLAYRLDRCAAHRLTAPPLPKHALLRSSVVAAVLPNRPGRRSAISSSKSWSLRFPIRPRTAREAGKLTVSPVPSSTRFFGPNSTVIRTAPVFSDDCKKILLEKTRIQECRYPDEFLTGTLRILQRKRSSSVQPPSGRKSRAAVPHASRILLLGPRGSNPSPASGESGQIRRGTRTRLSRYRSLRISAR